MTREMLFDGVQDIFRDIFDEEDMVIENKTSSDDVEEWDSLNHINLVIKPALNQGKIVISDRFADSTFVYQGYANGFGINKAKDLHKKLLNNFLPNKTFIFVLSPKEIIDRLARRKVMNKYDKHEIEFHKKISLGYKKISKNQKRFVKIDAKNDKKTIHNQILQNLGL